MPTAGLHTIYNFFSLEAWGFICGALYPTMRPIVYSKSRTVINRFCDLSLSSTSSLVSFAMLRFQTATELQQAREIFGSTFGIGSQNHAPRKGYGCRVLQVGDVVNIVKLPAEVMINPTENFKEFIPAERIELVYEEVSRTLSIRAKYGRVLVEDPNVSAALGFNQPLIRPQNTNPDVQQQLRREQLICVGTTFIRDRMYLKVLRSEGGLVTAVCEDTGKHVCLSNEEAWMLVRQNIG
jgi:hypothetical protein